MFKLGRTKLGSTFKDSYGVSRKLFYTDITDKKTGAGIQTIMAPTRAESRRKAQEYTRRYK
jgi:hypothetical protein